MLVDCEYCGLGVEKRKIDYEKGVKHFCSHRCRAIFYNHKRRTLFPRLCLHPGCTNLVTKMDRAKKFCSQECATVVNNVTHYSKQIIIEKIREFYRAHARIPVKYELENLYTPARYFFGTWNKAIVAAGFEPNPVMFAKHYIAQDGHKCDSLAEKIVDDWLYSHNIAHTIHIKYPWNNGMKCDFLIGNVWVEIFGLSGTHTRYDELKEIKLKLAQQYSINILPLFLRDVYKNGLGDKLSILIDQQRRPN